MTTKHTPAPWRRADSDYYFNVLLGKDGVIKLEKSLNTNQLLQNQANAKLIAAAPDLLEALQLIFKHYDRNNGEAPHHCHAHKAHWDLDDSPCEVCSDWEKARAAINKAIQ
jgi:hypothetical protein